MEKKFSIIYEFLIDRHDFFSIYAIRYYIARQFCLHHELCLVVILEVELPGEGKGTPLML